VGGRAAEGAPLRPRAARFAACQPLPTLHLRHHHSTPPPPKKTKKHRLAALAGPLILQAMSSMLLTLISTAFVGRLNDAAALSGVVLASSVYNVSGLSMCGGPGGGGAVRRLQQQTQRLAAGLGRAPQRGWGGGLLEPAPPRPHPLPWPVPPGSVIGLSSALDTLCGQVRQRARARRGLRERRRRGPVPRQSPLARAFQSHPRARALGRLPRNPRLMGRAPTGSWGSTCSARS
jgi:hypothetical protein